MATAFEINSRGEHDAMFDGSKSWYEPPEEPNENHKHSYTPLILIVAVFVFLYVLLWFRDSAEYPITPPVELPAPYMPLLD